MEHAQETAESLSELAPLKADRKAPQRRCIVCRESFDKERLIRFVVGPEQQLTPDIAHKLPGRGIWVECTKAALQQAIDKKLFARAAREVVHTPDNLLPVVQQLLHQRALDFLALANKAGELLNGFDTVQNALKQEHLLALLHSTDASEDGVRKLYAPDIERLQCFSRTEMGQKLGREEATHLALLDGSAGQAALKEIRRFTGFL